MQRLMDFWVTVPKWWKTFYIAFPILMIVLLSTGPAPGFALPVAFLWASMMAVGMWASEKLKERMRGKDNTRDRGDPYQGGRYRDDPDRRR